MNSIDVCVFVCVGGWLVGWKSRCAAEQMSKQAGQERKEKVEDQRRRDGENEQRNIHVLTWDASHWSSRTIEGSDLAPSMNSSSESLPSEFLSIWRKIFSVLFSGVASSSGILMTEPTIL